MTDEERLIGTAEAAEILHVTPRTIHRRVDTGQIPIVGRVGKHKELVFREADVLALADNPTE